jgi:hypothetical protein
MADLLSVANIVAAFTAVITVMVGLYTYARQKDIDLKYQQDELKREAVTAYLSSLDALINHAAFCQEQGNHDQAGKILTCKEYINRIYIYAPANVVDAMDTLLTEATALASIVSKIPNSEIFNEDKQALYENEQTRTHDAYIQAVNIARKEIGLYKEPVKAVQLLLLGKK